MISLKEVSHIYNAGTPIEKKVLSRVTLAISNGETLGIMGSPGSGKTTLAMIMAGLIEPTSGNIITPGPGPGKTGLLFQFPEHQLFCDTVFNDITYPLREIMELSSSAVEDRYEKACKGAGLDPDFIRKERQSELSDGERRRVAIASVLAMEPSVLILDEPTSGLDPVGKTRLLNEIKNLSDQGKTVIIISHDIEDLLHMAKRIIFIDKGLIRDDGPARKILSRLSEKEETLAMLPYVTEVLVRLKRKGVNIRDDIYDPREAFEEIKKVLKNR
ncbi:MAG: ATP-binding cassette domain-containing protein [Deltaproteobacteria bacterium]|nr:ATP-binding cassette domain-containing protein [Deltaproteobacteria bacterium]